MWYAKYLSDNVCQRADRILVIGVVSSHLQNTGNSEAETQRGAIWFMMIYCVEFVDSSL